MSESSSTTASAVEPIPADYPVVIPYLSVVDAAGAIEFYCKAFGATERMRLPSPDGKIVHAELQLGDGVIMLAEEFPAMGGRSPKSLGGTPVIIHVYVKDVDALAARAGAAGATLMCPVEDKFYGDRSAMITDPYGHVWNFATHTRDVSTEEMSEKFAELCAKG